MGIGSLRRHHDSLVEIKGAVVETAPAIEATAPQSTSVTIAELRELALEAGHDEAEIKGLKKAELIELLAN